MDKLRKDLEVLRSWGVESIPVDKVLSMIDEVDADEDVITGEDCVGALYSPCEEESSIDVLFKGIASKIITTYPVGGRIFYIDDTADGIYEFFDVEGNLLQNVQVGDRPYYYRAIKKGSKDKYYVYHDKVYDNLEWAYCKDKGYVYESLGTSWDIGSGKTNTEKVMSKDSGAYITVNSNELPTVWYQLQQIRNAKVGGCDDWFVPSRCEIDLLVKAIKSGIIIGGAIARSSYAESIFANKWIWSSSEHSSRSTTWFWSCLSQSWSGVTKDYDFSVFFVRAF